MARAWATAIFGDSVDEEIFSQEINLISPDANAFNWILGAYYQNDEYTFPPGEFYIGVRGAASICSTARTPKETTALFGQVSFDMTARLRSSRSARATRTARTANRHQRQSIRLAAHAGPGGVVLEPLGQGVAELDESNEHHFLYAFVATGFRPGGLNVPVGLGEPAPFDEEKVTSYEIGWKAGWADGHLRTQLNAFYNDYENFQVTVGYPDIPVFGFELNNPNSTEIYGFEAQLEAVVGAFSLDAGFGWLKSALGEFYAVDPRAVSFGACDPMTGPASAACINLEGKDQTYAPELTFNIGMQYDFGLGEGNSLTPRINYGHVSEQWATLFQNEARGDRVEARDILNAQVAWKLDTFVTTLYGTNLTDQHYVGAINSGLRFAGAPRQFGIRIAKTF